jgi:lysophospholipase L1-like esterase
VDARGDGPVRLMGVSLERNSPGVIVDTLGIPGARIRDRLPWNDEIVRAQVAALAPDLIVLAYGTNDTSTHRPLDTYRHELDEALRRARAMRPHASCLVIGPSDWPLQNPDGSFSPRPRTMEINHAHREAAARANCAFFDLVAFQGGPGSMPRWVGAGLALDDYVHFSDEGYRLIGQALARALLADYRE